MLFGASRVQTVGTSICFLFTSLFSHVITFPSCIFPRWVCLCCDAEMLVDSWHRNYSRNTSEVRLTGFKHFEPTPGWWWLFSITTVTLRRFLWKDSNPGWEEATSCRWRLLKRCSLVFSISAAGRLSHCSLSGPRGVSLGWWTKAAPGLRRICSLSGEQLSRCNTVNLKAWKGLKHSDSFRI